MPRTAREISSTGIYHVMLRGIDRRDLFLKNADYQKFIENMEKAKDKSEFTIFAYCLMTNHIHILLKTQTETLGDIVRRITVGYAQYHNIQNGRTGHLFQNRYRSEAVDDDEYFLTVLRYIHQNPVKAGIVKDLIAYRWSSYNEYISNKAILVEPTFALGFFKDIKHFKMFMKEQNEDKCLDYDPIKRYSDDDLREYIASFTAIDSLTDLDRESRDKVLARVKEVTGASNRQLSRVFDIGRGVLDRIK